MHKYITDPASVKHISAEVLYGILTSLGLSQEEVENMPLGEVFELVPKTANGSAEAK
jgi:hypothetical protein